MLLGDVGFSVGFVLFGFDVLRRVVRMYVRVMWDPILAAHELSPGVWTMIDTMGHRYAVIRFLELNGECGYRAVTWAEESSDRRLIGYFRSLRGACAAAHEVFIRSHAPGGFAPNPWPR